MINWWVISGISIWVWGIIAAILEKDSDCLVYSIAGSVLLGIFYMIAHGI